MSVNLEGLVPVRTLRMGGQVDWDDPIQIPNGLAIVCQNMQFLAESVKVRWGMRNAMVQGGYMADATGVDVLTVLGSPSPPKVNQKVGGASVSVNALNAEQLVGNNSADWDPWTPPNVAPGFQVSIVFTDQGEMFLELPAGNGFLVIITESISHLLITRSRIATSLYDLLPTGAYMLTAKAYNRIYQAFLTLAATAASAFQVLALDAATGLESVVGQNPLGAAWQPDTFYQEGDIVTPVTLPTATNPYFTGYPTYFRRTATGYSGASEPAWPTAFGCFANVPSDYTALPATANDGSVNNAWQEWNPGFPIYLPTPNPLSTITDDPGAGTIPAGQDVYICLSFFNDLGESAWTSPIVFENTSANDEVIASFLTGASSGPYLPSWLMSVMPLGTVGGLHWPATQCVRVYVNAVAHGSPAPTQYYLSGSRRADTAIIVDAIPSGTLLNPRTQPTAAISAEPFMGEGGSRYAALLRQDTMGNLSPIDPRMAIPVTFEGALEAPGSYFAAPSASSPLFAYVNVDDITGWANDLEVQVTVNGALYTATTSTILDGQQAYEYPAGNPPQFQDVPTPAGCISLVIGSLPLNLDGVACVLTVEPGPCPVAVVPPGNGEYPTGYSYDIVAFTVSGLGPDGPFNYLAAADPPNPATTYLISETTDGNGNGLALVGSLGALVAGETVLISGWTGGQAVWNGLRVLATAAAVSGQNIVTFPDPAATMSSPGDFEITMAVVQILPTQAVAGTVGIVLQFDDTSLPEGVDVTGNLLFVAIPPCTDLAYIPSVDRMAYVSDAYPTSIIFSEESFMGEVDGENDILSVEPANGAILAGVRELLNGTIIAAKQNGGYQVIPSADVPANWGLGSLWGNHGPWSGKNIAKGKDGARLGFFMFVDPEAGLYKWPPTLGQGEDLDWLSKELSGANNQDASRMATWDRVNRAAGATIEVVVDTIAKEIKVALPLDGATSPNYIATMSFFNGWQDPLMLTLSGEWVANRQSRRWNLDPIPTKCMALASRTLTTPVDQRVNYSQLLLGVLSVLASGIVGAAPITFPQATEPTIPEGDYYVMLAKVTGGNETAWSPVLGPFPVSYSASGGGWSVTTVQITLPGDELEDSWNLYFGTSPTTLTKKLNIANTVTTYRLTLAGAAATQPTGQVALNYMEPSVYDDLGGGYNARYRPAYAKEAPSQAWPDGGRVCRYSALTGHALGAGNMLITAVTDDPNYEPNPITVSLEEGEAEVPGSAPITHFNKGFKGDSEFLTVEFSNDGVAGAWFQLLMQTLWHKPLFPTR